MFFFLDLEKERRKRKRERERVREKRERESLAARWDWDCVCNFFVTKNLSLSIASIRYRSIVKSPQRLCGGVKRSTYGYLG